MAVINGTKKSDRFGGTNMSDRMYGFGGHDTIDGGHGHDMLVGGEGHDHLFGGTGSDTIYGGAGRDWLDGGNGADVFVGGLGEDRLYSGRDNAVDTFVFRTIHESTLTSYDRISVFESGIDKIDLSAIDADISMAGDQRFTVVAGFSGKAGELKLELNLWDESILLADVNGDGTADFKLHIYVPDYTRNVVASDIIL